MEMERKRPRNDHGDGTHEWDKVLHEALHDPRIHGSRVAAKDFFSAALDAERQDELPVVRELLRRGEEVKAQLEAAQRRRAELVNLRAERERKLHDPKSKGMLNAARVRSAVPGIPQDAMPCVKVCDVQVTSSEHEDDDEKEKQRVTLVFRAPYARALHMLEGFSHVWLVMIEQGPPLGQDQAASLCIPSERGHYEAQRRSIRLDTARVVAIRQIPSLAASACGGEARTEVDIDELTTRIDNEHSDALIVVDIKPYLSYCDAKPLGHMYAPRHMTFLD